MEQENQKNKLTKNSRGSGIKSVKGLKNNLLMRSKKETRGITLIALVITTIFSYDENAKSGNNKGFLLKSN